MKKIIAVFGFALATIVASTAFAASYTNDDAMNRPVVSLTAGSNAMKEEPQALSVTRNTERVLVDTWQKQNGTTKKCNNHKGTYCTNVPVYVTCQKYNTFEKVLINGTLLTRSIVGTSYNNSICK